MFAEIIFPFLTIFLVSCRISNDNLKAEVKSLSEKIAAIKSKLSLNKPNADGDHRLFEKIGQFLTISENTINRLKTVTELDMEKLRKNVADFFCEDIAQFKLEQCFQIFVAFVQRFKMAIEENRKRNENRQKIRARQQKQHCTDNSFTSLIETIGNGQSLSCQNDKTMFRSHDTANLVAGSDSTKFCSSLKRRHSRPCSQDMSNVDSPAKQDLVEFLKSTAHNDQCNGTNIDGNLFGTQFRRIGSGRRSLRGTSNNNDCSDNERERVIVPSLQYNQDPEPLIDSTSTTISAFNRFSPLRRTIKNQSKEDSDSLSNTDMTPPKITIEECNTNSESIKSSSYSKESANSKSNRNFLFEFKKKPLLNQYIQQLTAIISPSKYIENNDALHKVFENQSKNGSVSNQSPTTESANIIISTVAKERPSSLKASSSSSSGISSEQRRSFSFTSKPANRMAKSFVIKGNNANNKSNHAIVVPVQKMEKNINGSSLPHQSNTSSPNLDHKSPSPKLKSLTKEIGMYHDDFVDLI